MAPTVERTFKACDRQCDCDMAQRSKRKLQIITIVTNSAANSPLALPPLIHAFTAAHSCSCRRSFMHSLRLLQLLYPPFYGSHRRNELLLGQRTYSGVVHATPTAKALQQLHGMVRKRRKMIPSDSE